MAELAGILWLSAVAEFCLFYCQQKWPNAEVGRSYMSNTVYDKQWERWYDKDDDH